MADTWMDKVRDFVGIRNPAKLEFKTLGFNLEEALKVSEDKCRLSELTANIEVASWYKSLTDAMVGAITTAAHAGMPEEVAHQVMQAAMSAALPDAIIVSKGKSTPHPSKPVRDVL
ncbi:MULTISPECIES: hypothetical protein [Bacillales]|uniref:hypothetical protein n=1 Tax=Bacillales TaxID=1385 RepID=UPI00036CC76F|nr:MULTISPECIES: hypothetical protein [Bacillales]KMZ43974.1 hypothetical protein AC624_24405 [Bacillus sp. FJAT-27238]